MPIALLLLSATLASGVESTTWSGEQLAALTSRPAQAGCFVLAEGETADIELPSPVSFRSLGVWWEGDLHQLGATLLRADGTAGRVGYLPAADDLSPECAGPTGNAGQARVSALLHDRLLSNSCVAATLHLRGPVTLSRLTLVWIGRQMLDQHSSPASPPGIRASYPKPPVESRSSWGALPPTCTYSYCPTTHIGIHHTASPSEYSSASLAECAANVRATQDYHMFARGWCDIGYNYLVCVHGRIWEGRGGGDDVRGAHDGHNCGSMGVAFMGWFHSPYNQTPTSPMLDAIGELGAWKCDQQGIDPLSSAWYSGFGGTMETVFGHRDVSSTACPGDLLYSELPNIRADIASRIAGGSLVLDTDDAHFLGAWSRGTMAGDKFGSDYRWASTVAPANSVAWWSPDIPAAGRYSVDLWWSAGANRSSAVQVGVKMPGSPVQTSTVDQRQNGGQWNRLGTVSLPAGTGTRIGLSNLGTPGSVVIADALRLVRQ